ncbi:MAG: patatin-like phospholipase family protein [Reichenbachiella sp.]|uniref:patatin-like phospholipase family protein n=1 Tax=Reichenbachiella sp. TaxID=2184521 RepID=UPI003265EB30
MRNDTFHLGLTMAGAVSAGAYTGGVMDYLFEALDKWERAKNGEIEGVDQSLVPKHKVIIDAMGGTSAGGMTTIMSSLYAIKGEVKPVTRIPNDTNQKQDNVFWDSWIILDDDQQATTLAKALSITDLKTHKKILSLLNSEFIDRIAERAFSLEGDSRTNPSSKIPPYISSQLQMLVSHSMIRGIPLQVPFKQGVPSMNEPPAHATYEHFLFSHFHLNDGQNTNPDEYIWLNPYQNKSKHHLINAAKATGAFPVGLRFREFDWQDFSPEYLKNILSRLILNDMSLQSPDIKDEIEWDETSLKSYLSNTVDGGAINNEPYAEVQSLIQATGNTLWQEGENGPKYQMQGVVMIDPFPDFWFNRDKYEHAEDLLGVAPGIIGTLWDQAKVKRREMKLLFEFDGQDDTMSPKQKERNAMLRGLVYPVKYDDAGKIVTEPLACGSLQAFGGFLDYRFREHDFFLGRNNARNYIRKHLSVPYDPDNKIIHPLHSDDFWTEDIRQKFLITKDDGSTHLPLIPDMNLLIEEQQGQIAHPWDYTVKEMPKMTHDDIRALKPKVKKRIREMAGLLTSPLIDKIKLNWTLKWLKPKLKKRILNMLASESADAVEKIILKDLKDRGMLK